MVRHAKEQDTDQLLNMYRELRHAGLPGCTWNSEYPSDEDIMRDIDMGTLYVLEENGQIMGALATEDDEVVEMMACDETLVSRQISRVAICRSCQGRGLCSHLLEGALALLRTEGNEVIRLLVSPNNVPALHAYLRAGFQPIGEGDRYDVHWLLCEKML